MKKIISIFCSIMLICSLCSVTALASNTDCKEDTRVVEKAEETSNMIATFATSKGLWYEENRTIYEGAVDNMTVTPDKGANLRIWLKNDQPVKIAYAKTFLGQFVGVGEKVFHPGERDVLLVSNCNGKTYQVKMTPVNMYAGYSVLLYQN